MNAVVAKAKYINNYKVEIHFKDGHQSIVDFQAFLDCDIPEYLKVFKDKKLFQKFHIENGNIVWGEG